MFSSCGYCLMLFLPLNIHHGWQRAGKKLCKYTVNKVEYFNEFLNNC